MSEYIKECPFCRSTQARVGEELDASQTNKYFVECGICNARSGMTSSRQNAIVTWNEMSTACFIYKGHDTDLQLRKLVCPYCGVSGEIVAQWRAEDRSEVQLYCENCGFAAPFAHAYFKTAHEVALENFKEIANKLCKEDSDNDPA